MYSGFIVSSLITNKDIEVIENHLVCTGYCPELDGTMWNSVHRDAGYSFVRIDEFSPVLQDFLKSKALQGQNMVMFNLNGICHWDAVLLISGHEFWDMEYAGNINIEPPVIDVTQELCKDYRIDKQLYSYIKDTNFELYKNKVYEDYKILGFHNIPDTPDVIFRVRTPYVYPQGDELLPVIADIFYDDNAFAKYRADVYCDEIAPKGFCETINVYAENPDGSLIDLDFGLNEYNISKLRLENNPFEPAISGYANRIITDPKTHKKTSHVEVPIMDPEKEAKILKDLSKTGQVSYYICGMGNKDLLNAVNFMHILSNEFGGGVIPPGYAHLDDSLKKCDRTLLHKRLQENFDEAVFINGPTL